MRASCIVFLQNLLHYKTHIFSYFHSLVFHIIFALWFFISIFFLSFFLPLFLSLSPYTNMSVYLSVCRLTVSVSLCFFLSLSLAFFTLVFRLLRLPFVSLSYHVFSFIPLLLASKLSYCCFSKLFFLSFFHLAVAFKYFFLSHLCHNKNPDKKKQFNKMHVCPDQTKSGLIENA